MVVDYKGAGSFSQYSLVSKSFLFKRCSDFFSRTFGGFCRYLLFLSPQFSSDSMFLDLLTRSSTTPAGVLSIHILLSTAQLGPSNKTNLVF